VGGEQQPDHNNIHCNENGPYRVWVKTTPALSGIALRQACVIARMLLSQEKPAVAGKGRKKMDRQSHLRLLHGLWHIRVKTKDRTAKDIEH